MLCVWLSRPRTRCSSLRNNARKNVGTISFSSAIQWFFVLLTVFTSLIPGAIADLLNVTYDDSAMEDDHGASIAYNPAGSWQDAAHCTGESFYAI